MPPSVRACVIAYVSMLCVALPISVKAQATDPGVRREASDQGPPVPIAGLSQDERAFFDDGAARFATVEVVSGATVRQGNGLGPAFNSNQCSSCHSQPYVGGSAPARNPLLQVATADGASNTIPWFEIADGPAREARFVETNGLYDGGVHNLFVVTGRSDAGSCNLQQPSWTPAGDPKTGKGGNANIVFRIATPTLGSGLIEAIPDSTIIANLNANAVENGKMGIRGHANAIQGGNANLSANDGTITRFGWKAQNKSLLMFAGEAYNVEMGISNQLFPQERNESANCRAHNATPEDTSNFTPSSSTPMAVLSDIEAFANFMRMLGPPHASPTNPSTANGLAQFKVVGCASCHTPQMMTGSAVATGSSRSPSPALSGKSVNLFSDLAVHHMGTDLADGLTQGSAGPDEFRTAPLWGVGQRVYFMHDGRTNDLLTAIHAHSSQGSEANQVVWTFDRLSSESKQDLLNFLRSL